MFRLKLKFWGVRGSKPTPGKNTMLFGGNTACLELQVEKKISSLRSSGRKWEGWIMEKRFIFDAGTGIANLGQEMMNEPGPSQADIFFSHLHWDHIQGLPFFTPLYVPGNSFRLHGENKDDNGMSFRQVIEKQMRPPHFPITMQMMKSDYEFITIGPNQIFEYPLTGEGEGGEKLVITSFPVNHPNGCLAYKMELGESKVIFATDTEPMHTKADQDRFVEFISGSDVFIYDTHFTDLEYYEGPEGKMGWGHSTWQEGTRLAYRAGIDYLILFHHKDDRSDREEQEIEIFARQEHANTVAAREGMSIIVGGEGPEKVVVNYPY